MSVERTNGSDPVRSLARSHLIGDLTAESLQHLASLARVVDLGRGEVLFFHGDDGDAMYIVQSGSIEISVSAANGKKLVLNVMQPPDVFGEIAALDGGPRTATATVLEPTKVLRFDRSRILQKIHDEPELATDIVQILCARLRWISRQVEDLALHDIEGRLANRILVLNRKIADSSGSIRLSQSDLADFLGVTRESINKVLQHWRARGMIELSRGALRVRNPEDLEEIADPR